MNISRQYLTVNRYSRPGTKLREVTKVAVHYTGNPGSQPRTTGITLTICPPSRRRSAVMCPPITSWG